MTQNMRPRSWGKSIALAAMLLALLTPLLGGCEIGKIGKLRLPTPEEQAAE